MSAVDSNNRAVVPNYLTGLPRISGILVRGWDVPLLFVMETHVLSGNKAEQLEEWATGQRFSFCDEFDRNELGVNGFLNAIDDWQAGTNLISGRYRGVDIQMFDMKQCLSSRDHEGHRSTSYPTRTAILVVRPDRVTEAGVSLRHRGGIMQFFGISIGAVSFSTEGGFPEDQEVLAQFNRDYFAAGSVFGTATEPGTTPDFIGIELLRSLLESDGWSLEVGESHIAFYCDRRVIPIEERSDALEQVCEFVQRLESGQSGSPKIVATAVPNTGLMGVFFPMLWLFGGAVCGMFATFALFATLMFSVEKMETWMVLLFPIVGLPMMAGGAFLGSKLRNRVTK